MAPKAAEGGASSEESDQKGSHLWSLLPSFDPSSDEIKEYVEKVRFLQGICPQADKAMLAPRLSMLCRGTAWQQVRNIPAGTLTDPKKGVDALLSALSSWEEISEMQTYEKFEKALFKVYQKSDEAVNSYVNRMQVAFADLDDKLTLKEIQAFLLLRQSALTIEDKKKVLTMVNGPLTLKEVEKSMRALSTKILVGTAEKKKIYPANYVEPETPETEPNLAPTMVTSSWTEEAEECDQETINYMAGMGDPDANIIQDFERDLEEAMQEIPDLQQAMVTYMEARQRITEKKKSRQFWPAHGSSGGKNSSKGFGKKRGKGGGKASLLDRIARSYCKVCGRKGHWKAECPDREKEQANTVISMDGMQEQFTEDVNHVVIEEMDHEALDQVLQHRIDQNNIAPHSDNIEDISKSLEVVFAAFHNPAKRQSHPEKAKWFTTENLARLQTFYQSRLSTVDKKSKTTDIHQKQEPRTANRLSQNPVNQEPAAPVCVMSSDGITGGTQSKLTLGMAILDTGASRSVVGEDHVPNILEQLPEQIRNVVKEKGSRVGFRFGNNQIEYSFKQLHIPLIHGNQRVWIIIEVVPRATPFLISIHTMKCLRAVIDLESGSCFLKSIGRSIPITENRNGLMTLKIQDLCRVHRSSKVEPSEAHETCAAAFSEFKSCENATRHSTSLTDNADPGGNGTIDQGCSRGGIMESLRLLLLVLMSQFEVHSPSQEVSLEYHQQVSNLVSEVQSQRGRIDQLMTLVQDMHHTHRRAVPTQGQPTSSVTHPVGQLSHRVLDEENLSELEWDAVDPVEFQGATYSPPRSPAARSRRNPAVAGPSQASSRTSTATPANPTPEDGPQPVNLSADQQLALTHMTMESWGNKRISWGKKHHQTRYCQVYEEDPGYSTWLRPRQNLNPAMSDFLAYCSARENLEAQAGNLARRR